MNIKSNHKALFVLILSLSLSLGIMLAFSGCANESIPETPAPPNPATEEPNAPPSNVNPPPIGAVAMLINMPTGEERSEYTIVDTLELQETDESIIFVALEDGTSIKVVEIAMQDGGNIVDGDTVYSVTDAPKDFALELKAFRPEGAPSYKLVIDLNDVETVYYISYNGKDGNPKIEYIF